MTLSLFVFWTTVPLYVFVNGLWINNIGRVSSNRSSAIVDWIFDGWINFWRPTVDSLSPRFRLNICTRIGWYILFRKHFIFILRRLSNMGDRFFLKKFILWFSSFPFLRFIFNFRPWSRFLFSFSFILLLRDIIFKKYTNFPSFSCRSFACYTKAVHFVSSCWFFRVRIWRTQNFRIKIITP